MPAIFYRDAYEAACRDSPPRQLKKLSDEHFEDFKLLNEALQWLTPAQRCNAIYGSWLKSLNGPDSGVLLEVRNRLIRQGGLAANYLAEFAQNADDAFPRPQGGDVRIWTKPGWLLVANNGRRFTGIDLLGLCRFFANGAKQINTSELTIGKFGIGFKSCYRIGSEVWVRTWDAQERFAFRIPLCRQRISESHYDKETFTRLVAALRLNNPRTSQDELGYCTPEFRERLPDEVAADFANVEQTFETSGSMFAVRLHAEGEAALATRLEDQSSQVYELCPLFLRRLRSTSLEETTLRLSKHDTELADSIPGAVIAEKITLEAQARGKPKSNARFWRLTQDTVEKPWRMALHADSNFALNVARQDEETMSLRDGAAYAFFPLSTVTANWPFRLHLHLDHATNLDRSNWSPEDPKEVRAQIQSAVEGMCAWLETHRSKWHPEWSLSSIVQQRPPRPMPGAFDQQPAWWLFEELQKQIKARPLLRTISGGFANSSDARYVPVRAGRVFKEAWRELGKQCPQVFERRAWCTRADAESWGIAEAKTDEMVAFIQDAQKSKSATADPDRCAALLFSALLGIEVERRVLLDESLKALRVPCADCSMMDLFQSVGGTTLSTTWHEMFAALSAELRDSELGERTIGGRELSEQLLRFARPAFNPSWSSIPDVFHDGIWLSKGDEFWSGTRRECPEKLIGRVLPVLRVRDASQNFQPLLDVWLVQRSVPSAFSEVLRQPLPPRQADYVRALRSWGLWESYEAELLQRLASALPGVLSKSLRSAATTGDIPAWFEACRRARNEADNVGLQWGVTFAKGVETAIESVLAGDLARFAKTSVLSRSIPEPLRAVACWIKGFEQAPPWLTDQVADQLQRHNGELLGGFAFLSARTLSDRLPDIARQLLLTYHAWGAKPLSPEQFQALNKIFASPNRTERKQMTVGLTPRTSRQLGDFLVIEESATDPNSYWLAQARSADEVRLPEALKRFADLAEVCGRVSDLKLKVEDLPESGLKFVESEIADDIASLPVLQRVLRSASNLSIHQHSPLKLEWYEEDRCVATVAHADFVVLGQRLYVSRLKVRPEDQQFEVVLGNYIAHAAQDKDVRTAWDEAKAKRAPLHTVYNRFRDRIFKQLCRAFIEDAGYAPEHIWRELLQNAENAYASLPDPQPPARPFFCRVQETPDGKCRLVVGNEGRRFNAADRDGNARDDVERIISVGGDRQQTALEIGRYNLGFKAVFSVTETVEIRSGGREFTVKDLLLRYPASPPVLPERVGAPTSFSWTCSKREAATVAGIPLNAASGAVSRFLRAPHVVFTRFVTEVSLDYRGMVRAMRIQRSDLDDGTRVAVTEPNGLSITFRVWRGQLPLGSKGEERRFAVAVQVDPAGLPACIAPDDAYFHLVFPTEHKAWMGYLIDAEFDMHGQNRGQIQDSTRNLSLINAAVRTLFDAAEEHLDRDVTKPTWLAWARVLAPEHFWQGAKSFFTEKLAAAEQVKNDIRDSLLSRIPHHGRACQVQDLTVPSALLRRFATDHAAEFDIPVDDWIDAEVEVAARELGAQTNLTLGEWIGELGADDDLLQRVRDALEIFQPKAIEVDEMRRARDLIGRRVQAPVVQIETWPIERLVNWWRDNQDDEPYSLAGDLYQWVAPGAAVKSEAQRTKNLLKWLSEPETAEGREVWYRTLAYACLVSAGRHHSEVVQFEEALGRCRFFEKTSSSGFSLVADDIFLQLLQKPLANDSAAGEQADFWRRLFYDVRKVHHLVYQNDFPSVFLDLCRREDRASGLIPFLRSGQLAGQSRWRGVIGQSALSPLFFVIRELRRLGVIQHPEADRTAFFVCRPVRRTARRLGWISEEEEFRSDQDSLIEVASKIYDRYNASPLAREHLLPHFDIPLLALDQSGALDHFA